MSAAALAGPPPSSLATSGAYDVTRWMRGDTNDTRLMCDNRLMSATVRSMLHTPNSAPCSTGGSCPFDAAGLFIRLTAKPKYESDSALSQLVPTAVSPSRKWCFSFLSPADPDDG